MERQTLLERIAAELGAECPQELIINFEGEGVDAKMVVTLTDKYKREFQARKE